MSKEKTFVRITNQDIFQKLINIENQVKISNGKIKLNRWIATTALTLVLALAIALLA